MKGVPVPERTPAPPRIPDERLRNAHINRAVVRQQWAYDAVSLHLMADWHGVKSRVVTYTMETFDPLEPISPYDDRDLMLTREASQELMDSLWQCGIRPTDGAGTAGAMAQAQAHIESLKAECVEYRQIIDRLLKDGQNPDLDRTL